MKSKRGIEKNAKMAGAGSGCYAEWMPANKIKPFKVLFNKIRESVGTYDGARHYIGLGGQALDDLEKGKLSAFNGRKILEAYRKLSA